MTLPSVPIFRKGLRSFQVFGANTGVGKTVLTNILCNAANRIYPSEQVAYLKPVSAGPENDRDDRHIERFASGIQTRTLHQYDIPVSPHLAARVASQGAVSDQQVLAGCASYAASIHQQGKGWLFVETAGGVNSPSPSGTTQAEMYRPLRLPVVLVGDSKLGGISLSISAFESLRARGYDVESLLIFKDAEYDNSSYLTDYFGEKYGLPVSVVTTPPSRADNPSRDAEAMDEYYQEATESSTIVQLLRDLDLRHTERAAELESMANDAEKTLWYPFTQHNTVDRGNISVVESAHGDFFHTLDKQQHDAGSASLRPTFDGSASWWTQGLGHGNTDLTLAAAYAAGRYGHVLYPGMVHAPALALAKTLLNGLQNPRLSRVFYSDNGSTGNEVAIKMALRAARLRYNWTTDESIGILGLKGSYHGDTIGAMDCSEPGTFNKKVEWYKGKGFWFDVPSIACSAGQWSVDYPDSMSTYSPNKESHTSLSSLFDIECRIERGEHLPYQKYIEDTLKVLQGNGQKFGALMLEPIVLGAGGMILVDPLFQRALVDTVRQSADLFTSGQTPPTSPASPDGWAGLPVIFDEVFTGLYRLGRFAAASFLGTSPDISVHAKLLTGGLVPLCATAASEEIFECFLSNEKSEALLHGHSYTAHAVGCQVALESLKQLKNLDVQGHWKWAKAGSQVLAAKAPSAPELQQPEVWSMWSADFVTEISNRTDQVDRVWALGSVLAIHMRDNANSGYNSSVSKRIQEIVFNASGDVGALFNVHVRVLGNVFYVMTSQTTSEAVVRKLQQMIRDAFSAA